MTRIAIVEDDAAVREQLAGYVQRYTRQYGTQFEVTMFTDDVEILEDYRMAQYAIKGYAVGALDYVLKPVPYFAF